MTRAGRASILLLLGLSFPLAGESGDAAPRRSSQSSVEYDGRYTFTRIQYGRGMGRSRGGQAAWAHDYPDADLNMQLILAEVSTLRTRQDRSNVFWADDPNLTYHPIAYLSEPGFWQLTDEEAIALRNYILKGGFLIFDDFEANQWYNFEAQMRRVLPDHDLVELDLSHPVFDSFFHMEKIDVPHPLVAVEPRYYGVFEDNDPRKRLMVMVNYNSDLAEYWEYAGTGYFPMDLTNDAWRLGVNYIIYGLTH